MNTRPAAILTGLLILVATALGAYFLGTRQGEVLPTPAPTVERGEPVVSESGNIKVSQPLPLQTVSSPLAVRGEARVFENNVEYRLTESDGTVLAEGFATAQAPDIGQFGPFEATIGFNTETEVGTLEVFSTSPKDGSEINKVTIPLIFR